MNTNPKLSILICSLPNRLKNFSTIEQVEQQAKGLPVEVLYLGDNWQHPTGWKRNRLKNMASGNYIGFVDDDDILKEDYVEQLLKGTESRKDVITFDVEISINGAEVKPVYFSLEHERDLNRSNRYIRIPNHLMYFRKHLSQQIDFPEIVMGEDTQWALKMKKITRNEYKINKFLYHYEANQLTSESIKNIRRYNNI